MRILKIQFQNLNSLAGEWEIDLTHPEYESNGIFAITGPTGAGKTTILDAVCLALYGRTPRLDRVSKSVNEIMSRQTGECRAEVTFETLSGKYLCKWTQRRARNRPDGELQQPHQEIAMADTGEILGSSIREVAEIVESATGMDFDRFTRSMLLAQGGFAAFLQAGPDARAPILEQITGTEIYSLLSIQVHARRAEERAVLASLEIQKAALRMLAPEEAEVLAGQLTETENREREASIRFGLTASAIAWKERMEGLDKNLAEADRALEALRCRREQFQPSRLRMETADIAATVELDYVMLSTLQQDQQVDRNTVEKAQQDQPTLEAATEQAQQELLEAERERERLRLALQEAQPMLREVRALDLRLQEKQVPIHAADEAVKALTAEQAALQMKIQADEQTLQGLVAEIATVDAAIAAMSVDSALVGEWAGLQAQAAAWINQERLYTSKSAELESTREMEAKAQEDSTAAAGRLADVRREVSSATLQRQQALSLIEQILEGRTAPDWRAEQALMREQKQQMDRADASLLEITSKEASIEVLETQGTALAGDILLYEQGIQASTVERDSRESLVALLRNEHFLARQVQTYEEARSHLVDGEPCPLCGSVLHPLVGETPVRPEQTRVAMELAEKDLKTTESLLNEYRQKAAAARVAQDNAVARLAEMREARVRETDKLAALIQGVFPEESTESVLTRWKGLRAMSDMNLEMATARMAAFDKAETEMQEAQKSLEALQVTASAAVQESLEAAHQHQSLEQDEARIRKELDIIGKSLDLITAGLASSLQVYGEFTVDRDSLAGALSSLAARRDLWQSRMKRQLELDRSIVLLKEQISALSERIQRVRKELDAQEALTRGLREEYQRIACERSGKFGDKYPDVEEQRWTSDVRVAEKLSAQKRDARDAALRLSDNGRSRIAELGKAIASRADKILAAEAAFARRLSQAGFANLASFLSARLTDPERKALRELAEQLDLEKAGLEARHADLEKRLAAERALKVTDLFMPALLSEKAELEEAIKSLRQETGALRQRLRDHGEAQLRNRELSSQMEAQRAECSRWDILHDLIGSADGKKYRNFAQGITFDLLIGHANSQLRRLSDRYLLVHDEHLPLELCVIDNDQAGEIRSTKNLSGGESFLVSLALALGLSRMSSRKVRVDSLFLDEGFGTLDEDTLETALSTLASLRHDGKLIGVISHVPAIRERIAARIQVVPEAGGRSTVTGPGCRSCLS